MSKLHSRLLVRVLVAAGMASVTGLAMAGATTGNVVMSANLVSACEVQNGAIAFGDITNLASAGDKVADTGTSFTIACSTGLSPTIASTTTRSMADTGATHFLPFQLSLTAGAAADDLPTTPTALTLTQNGLPQNVKIYAKVLKTSFTGSNALPGGAYNGTMVVDVAY